MERGSRWYGGGVERELVKLSLYRNSWGARAGAGEAGACPPIPLLAARTGSKRRRERGLRRQPRVARRSGTTFWRLRAVLLPNAFTL